MKQKILLAALAFVIFATAVPAYADGISESLILVDGRSVQIRTAGANGSKGYAVRDIVSSVGAKVTWDAKERVAKVTKGSHVVVFKPDSKIVIVDGKEVTADTTTSILEGLMFVDIQVLMEALEGETIKNGDHIFVSTAKLLQGAYAPKWLTGNRILVSTATDEGIEYYVVNTYSKKFDKLIEGKANAVDVAVSKDGTKVAYVNDKGAVYVVDILTGETREITKDPIIKSELQWSYGGEKIYYIAGEKSNAVAAVNVADGKIVTLFDDKVNYKSDLRVNNEGTKIVFAVTKEGKFSDVNGTITVDTTGTEPQLYAVDLTEKDAKAVQLTNNKDNKTHIHLLNNGQVIYIGTDMNSEYNDFYIKKVSADGKSIVRLAEDLNVMYMQVLTDDRIFALGVTADGEKAIYEIDLTTGKRTKVSSVDLSVSGLSLSENGTQILGIVNTEMGEIIALLEKNKTMIPLTK